jgi:hypothetical protein
MFDLKQNVPDDMGIRDRRDSNGRNQECLTRSNGLSYSPITADAGGAEEGISVELVGPWGLILPLPPIYKSRGGL